MRVSLSALVPVRARLVVGLLAFVAAIFGLGSGQAVAKDGQLPAVSRNGESAVATRASPTTPAANPRVAQHTEKPAAGVTRPSTYPKSRSRAAKPAGRVADDVVDDASRAVRAPSTPSGRLKQDFLDNPDDWKVWSSHAEAARNRAARGGGSIQTIYLNRRTGDRLVWHTVVSRSGRVIDDHPRPYYKARGGE